MHIQNILIKIINTWIIYLKMKKELNSEPGNNDKDIKTKKNYNDRVYTNFQHKRILKENEYCACLSVILWNSIFVNSNKEYYPQIFLEECKFAVKNIKIVSTINEDLELSESDDESDE